jgi:hypothetical protein
MKQFEIFFKDLNEGAQRRFLERFNMKEEDGNFELAPLAIVDMEVEKENNILFSKEFDYSKLTIDDTL